MRLAVTNLFLEAFSFRRPVEAVVCPIFTQMKLYGGSEENLQMKTQPWKQKKILILWEPATRLIWKFNSDYDNGQEKGGVGIMIPAMHFNCHWRTTAPRRVINIFWIDFPQRDLQLTSGSSNHSSKNVFSPPCCLAKVIMESLFNLSGERAPRPLPIFLRKNYLSIV